MLARASFQFSDPDDLAETLAAVTPHPPAVEPIGSAFSANMQLIALSNVSIFSLLTDETRVTDARESGQIGINIPLTGDFRFRRGREQIEVAEGEVLVRRRADHVGLVTVC